MSCFLIKWAEEFGILTFNFGLIHDHKYFRYPSQDLFLRYPHKKSFSSIKLQQILASSLNRISLRLLKRVIFKKIKSFDLLNLKTDEDYVVLESKIQNSDITFVRGFIHKQPYSIFRNIFSEIKGYFQISKYYESKVMEPIESLKGCDMIVGVAIRHGDYKNWQNGKYFLTTKIYQQWMEKVESFFTPKKVGFFIASDEEQDTSIFKKHNFFFRAGYPLANLYSLSKCDVLLSVPSSFAGWAHFIGETPLFNLEKNVKEIAKEEFKSW
jgi:hypothetical protein